MHRMLLIASVVAAAFACFAAQALAAPPATLTGQSFVDTVGGPSSVNCQQSGDFTFSASGATAGPYVGTFTETGSGHVTQQLPVVGYGTVTSFDAQFTVKSGTGDTLVTGTKTLNPAALDPGIVCQNTTGGTGAINTPTTYSATIYTPTGNYHDEGTSVVNFLFTDLTGTYLIESYTSTLIETTLIVPTSNDQCKDGGWKNYPQFKNQGDCVSFVATGGKNPPAIH